MWSLLPASHNNALCSQLLCCNRWYNLDLPITTTTRANWLKMPFELSINSSKARLFKVSTSLIFKLQQNRHWCLGKVLVTNPSIRHKNAWVLGQTEIASNMWLPVHLLRYLKKQQPLRLPTNTCKKSCQRCNLSIKRGKHLHNQRKNEIINLTFFSPLQLCIFIIRILK